ncbi:D-alanyl-D-alanine carboxypeptidase, partial [Nonomuraea sp. NPDC052116]
PRTIPLRPRDRLYAVVTLVLAVLLLPAAFLRSRGSAALARVLVHPPAESSHVKGIALDVRPHEGAHDLYRMYDNEWWHFEHRPDRGGRPPRRRPHPGVHHVIENGSS